MWVNHGEVGFKFIELNCAIIVTVPNIPLLFSYAVLGCAHIKKLIKLIHSEILLNI